MEEPMALMNPSATTATTAISPGRGRLLGSVIAAALVLMPLAACAGSESAAAARSRVIVLTGAGSERAVERDVVAAGGTVVQRLRIVHGFSASVPTGALARLRLAPGVASVSADAVLRPQGESFEAASYDPATDLGSMYNVTRMTGAQSYWHAGFTGAGVGVALIDSGVAPVDGLTVPGKVVNGPDLSFESQAPNLEHLDSYGHGTHMAGIIAGRSDSAVPGSYTGDSANFIGMAPDATIVSLKVADAHGATDVSQVIAAIDWVVQHRDDPGMNIRVLNLSYGTDAQQDSSVDPLAFAAEQAWKAGIFVVAASGNAGFAPKKTGAMMDPARDPNIMAVGATDQSGTLSTKDDSVATFSSTGSTKRRVDLVAPGSHIVSLRDPGSQIDQLHGDTGGVTETLFRGSGTSQATAVVSGAAALVIQQHPGITPSQIKQLFMDSASGLSHSPKEAQGRGELDLVKAFSTKLKKDVPIRKGSTGTGSLQAARGSTQLSMDGVVLTGEQDVMGATFDAASMASLEAQGKSWSGGTWNGKSWSGEDWSGSSWTGSTWAGKSWSGKSWSGSDWSGKSWSANAWASKGWASSDWSSNDWLSGGWAANAWADASWS
jgi:serine protease AprX